MNRRHSRNPPRLMREALRALTIAHKSAYRGRVESSCRCCQVESWMPRDLGRAPRSLVSSHHPPARTSLYKRLREFHQN